MKNLFKRWMVLLTVLGVLAVSGTAFAAGSSSAQLDSDLTLEDMLSYAIQDEYAAQAEYSAIMTEYGVKKPFANIIKAEGKHIAALENLFKTYGYEVPFNDAAASVVIPASLAEAYAVGVEAEIKNIDMYESFLEKDIPSDVEYVFNSLMKASEKHQAAFEKAGNGGTGGTGPGNGGGGNGRNN